MKLICLIAFLCLGYFHVTDGRAQQQGFPGGMNNGYPGGQQGGFPGMPNGYPGGFPGGFPGKGGNFPDISVGLPDFPGGFKITPKDKNAAMEQLKRQCIANGGEAAYNDLDKASNNMQKCIADVMPNIQFISDKTPGGMCTFMHTTIRKCMVEFTTKLERCMDKATAYAPGFTIEMLDSVFKFLCKNDAKHITVLITAIATPNTCLSNLKEHAGNCISGTKSFKIQSAGPEAFTGNFTKEEMCSDTKLLRDCVNQKARDYCSGEMYEFVTGISNAIYEPCSACKLFITNTFILLALLIITKLF